MKSSTPILVTAVMASSVVAGALVLHRDPDAPATGVAARVETYRRLGAQVATALERWRGEGRPMPEDYAHLRDSGYVMGLDQVDGLVGDAAWGVIGTPAGTMRAFTVSGVTREECRAIEESFDRMGIPDEPAGEEGCAATATGFSYHRSVAPYAPPVETPTKLATGPTD